MRLIVERCGEEAPGTAQWALTVESWPIDVTQERAQRCADWINEQLRYRFDSPEDEEPRGR